MKFHLYKDVSLFYKETFDLMMRHEVQNLVPLGNIIIGNQGNDKFGWRDPSKWFMGVVLDDNAEKILTAVMTPPFNLTLYATDNHINDEALSCLVNEIIENDIHIPMVMTEKILAEHFAKIYSKAKGLKYTIFKNIRMNEISKVNPEIQIKGKLRLAEEKDLSFFPYWLEEYNKSWFGESQNVLTDIERHHYEIASKKLYILEDNGVPVSMVKINREMQTICSTGMGYTPPYFRGKCYLTSILAGVSRMCLELGFSKCVANIDLADPIIFNIHKKIGYTPVCDFLEIKFE